LERVILLDTGPLVALCDRRDPYHERAVAELRVLAGSAIGSCEAVLVEASFHLADRAQRQRLRALLDRLEAGLLPAASNSTYRRHVFEWLLKNADHEPDWADACLAVLCSEDAAARVWTFDREFRTTWRRRDGSAIPLAIP
jgi:predicted nucleic acid-binding protein